MSYSLNSLKGGFMGDYIGATIRVIKGDTSSLEHGSYEIVHSHRVLVMELGATEIPFLGKTIWC